MLLCVNVMVMSSAYVVSFTCACVIYRSKSLGDRTPPCGTPVLNWRCVGVLFLNVVYALQPLMSFAINLRMVCGMFVWCSLCVSVCMLTVSNALLMFSDTVIVCSDGLFWLKPVAMVFFMVCSVVRVEWLLLKPYCVEICGILFVMYGSSVFSSVFAITERSEMGLYDVRMFMSLFGFGIGMMFASFHV